MTLNNEYFTNLFTQTWTETPGDGGPSTQYTATIDGDPTRTIYALGTDLQLRWEPSLAAIAEEYASDEELFMQEFAEAWVKMMDVDRFDGPAGNLCHTTPTPPSSGGGGSSEAAGGSADDARLYRCVDNRCVKSVDSSSSSSVSSSSAGKGLERASCEALCGAAAGEEGKENEKKEDERQQHSVLSSLLADML